MKEVDREGPVLPPQAGFHLEADVAMAVVVEVLPVVGEPVDRRDVGSRGDPAGLLAEGVKGELLRGKGGGSEGEETREGTNGEETHDGGRGPGWRVRVMRGPSPILTEVQAGLAPGGHDDARDGSSYLRLCSQIR